MIMEAGISSPILAMKEKTKILLICSAAIYGVIMFASVIVYFMMPYVVPQSEVQAAVTAKEAEEQAKAETEAELLARNAKEAEEAQKAREEQEKKEAEERKRKQERDKANAEKTKKATKETWGKDQHFRDLVSRMKETVRGNVTFYTHNYSSKPPSGIYIRPFVIKGKSDAILKNDVFYYVSLDDSNFNWVYGDNLDITADGINISWHFDSTKRHDKLSQGAEAITENYVETASEARINDLRTIGNARNVSLYYWHSGGGGRAATLSRENIRQIHEMIELYDILVGKQEKKQK